MLPVIYCVAVFFRKPRWYNRAIERAFAKTRDPLPLKALDRKAALERMAVRWRARGLL